MKPKRQYRYADTETALRELKELGYTVDFNVESEMIIKSPNTFHIDYIYHYEGMSNPDDESTVYGIEHDDHKIKGVFVAGNLAFDEDDAAKVLKQVEIEGRNHELD